MDNRDLRIFLGSVLGDKPVKMDLEKILGIGGEAMVMKKQLESGQFAIKIIPYGTQNKNSKWEKALMLIKHHIKDDQFERVSNKKKPMTPKCPTFFLFWCIIVQKLFQSGTIWRHALYRSLSKVTRSQNLHRVGYT